MSIEALKQVLSWASGNQVLPCGSRYSEARFELGPKATEGGLCQWIARAALSQKSSRLSIDWRWIWTCGWDWAMVIGALVERMTLREIGKMLAREVEG